MAGGMENYCSLRRRYFKAVYSHMKLPQ